MAEGQNQVGSEDFPKGRWKGKWISVPFPSRDVSQNHTLIFRKTIRLDSIPNRIPTRMTADSRYILWVNGVEVFRGPIRSQPRRLSYDMFDLAPYLKPGDNVICAQVRYYGEDTAWWIHGEANETLGGIGVFVFEALLGANWIITDATWKALASEAWDSVSMSGRKLSAAPLEVFDARKLSSNWLEAGFDDASWPDASVIPSIHMGSKKYDTPPTDPYGPMIPRPISRLTDQERTSVLQTAGVSERVATMNPDPVQHVLDNFGGDVHTIHAASLPITAQPHPDGNLVFILDFGEEVAGTVSLDLDASRGTVIDVSVAEALDDFARANQHAGFRYICRGHDDKFESFDPMGLRYVQICVSNLAGNFTLHAVTVCERLYPFSERGYFRSSDKRLDRIYEAGVRTVSLTSHDAFIDCPSREQRAWVGDSVVHQMVHLAVNADWALATWNPHLANSPRYDGILPMSVAGDIEAERGANIPEWSLHWIHSVYNVYQYVGDKDAIRVLLPSAERVLQWFLPFQAESHLLVDLPEWVLVDWSTLTLDGCSSLMNALFARGLLEFAEMSEWLGDIGRARWARNLWQEIFEAFEVFWDGQRRCYVDSVMDGVQGRAMSELAQALPICAKLVPTERLPILLRHLLDRSGLVRKSWITEVFQSFEETQGSHSEDANQRLMGAILRGSMAVKLNWDLEHESVAAQPFMRYVVHDAIVLAGGADKIAELCLDWMTFLEAGDETFWELWGGGSRCHGWSSTPTRDLIVYTLGVQPLDPGFHRAQICPHLGYLDWMEGMVPTPNGFINIRVDRQTITIDTPIPCVLSSADGTSYELPSGSHTIDTL